MTHALNSGSRSDATGLLPVPRLALIFVAALLLPVCIAFAMSVGNEAHVLAAVAGLICITVVLARPFWGLILLVGLLYVRPEESIPALMGLRLTLIISVVSFVGMLLQLALKRERLVQTPVLTMLAGFILCALLSTLPRGNTTPALEELGKLLLLILLVMNLAKDAEGYRLFVTSLIIFTAYLALYATVQYFTGNAMQYRNDGEEILRSQGSGIFNDPNDLAAFTVAGLALTLSRIAEAKRHWKLVYISLAALLIWNILLTNSRGGMLGLIVVAGGFVFLFVKNKRLAIVASVAVAALFLIFGPSRMTNFDSDESSANARFWFWSNGFDMLKENPVLGVGFRQFPENNDGHAAHNSFVLCFSEIGLPGYFFWIGALYCGFRRRAGKLRAPDELRGRGMEAIGPRLVLAGLLTACFWLSRTYVPVVYLFIMLPSLQTLSRGRQSESGGDAAIEPWRRNDNWRIAALCALSMGFIYVMVLVNR